MLQKIAIVTLNLLIAASFLVISVLRTASVKYEFSGSVNANDVLGESETKVDYYLAFPGKVLPDNPLWSVKAARDQLWLVTTTDQNRKAELYLLFADKRLAASKILFDKGDAEVGFETLLKAENYLREASKQERLSAKSGNDTSEFLRRLAYASLKHWQVIDEEILIKAPEDAKPEIIQILDAAKTTYEKASQSLNEKGLKAPENPFVRE